LVAALHSCGRNLQLASTDLFPAAQVMGATHSKIITLIVALELQNDTKVSVAHGCCTRMPGARKEPSPFPTVPHACAVAPALQVRASASQPGTHPLLDVDGAALETGEPVMSKGASRRELPAVTAARPPACGCRFRPERACCARFWSRSGRWQSACRRPRLVVLLVACWKASVRVLLGAGGWGKVQGGLTHDGGTESSLVSPLG
jgi:hypothetical protein